MPITILGALQQKKINVGKQVTILGDFPDLQYTAKIAEIHGQTLLLRVLTPFVYPLKNLNKEATITVTFSVPDDAIYSFAATISNCSEETLLLQVEQAAPFERTEQRSDFRLKTAKIIYVQEETKDRLLGPNWQKACLLDLSRGGASILTTATLQVGRSVNVWIPLDEVDYVLEAATQVVRVKKADEEQLVVGVRFNELCLQDQEKILDYILKVWTETKDAQNTEE